MQQLGNTVEYRVTEIAKWQRLGIGIVVGWIGLIVVFLLISMSVAASGGDQLSDVFANVMVALLLMFWVTAMFGIYKLANAIQTTSIPYILLALFISPLIVLVILSAIATGILKRNGVRVGMFGANRSDVEAKAMTQRSAV